jgi:cystathionine beta-lyase/cystathionine gamma-synthase
LSAGDHLVAGKALFGSCRVLVDNILPRFGIETTTVDATDVDAWARARRPNTRVFFLETPSNPGLEISDIRAIADLAHDAGAKVVVDNAFAYGKLLAKEEVKDDVWAIRAFNTLMSRQKNVRSLIVPMGDGMWVGVKE